MADDAQGISWQSSCSIHFCWTAVPEAADRSQGPWQNLKDYTEAAANKTGRLRIIAGPVFEANDPVGNIGQASEGEVPVAVPHGVFRVVVHETATERSLPWRSSLLSSMRKARTVSHVRQRPRPIAAGPEAWAYLRSSVSVEVVRRDRRAYGLRFLPDAAVGRAH